MSLQCASKRRPVRYVEVLPTDAVVIPISDSKLLQVSSTHGVNKIQASRDEGLATSSDSHIDGPNSSQSDSETEVLNIRSTALNNDSSTEEDLFDTDAENVLSSSPGFGLTNMHSKMNFGVISMLSSYDSRDSSPASSPSYSHAACSDMRPTFATSDAGMVQACADFLDNMSNSSSSSPRLSSQTNISAMSIKSTKAAIKPCSAINVPNLLATAESTPKVKTSEAFVDYTNLLTKYGTGELRFLPETIVREMRADPEAVANKFMIDGSVGQNIAKKLKELWLKISPEKSPAIMELTACCGGSVLQFAKSGLFSRVDAVEMNTTRCRYLKHNYEVLRDYNNKKLTPLQILNANFKDLFDEQKMNALETVDEFQKLDKNDISDRRQERQLISQTYETSAQLVQLLPKEPKKDIVEENIAWKDKLFDKQQEKAKIYFYDPIWRQMNPEDLYAQIALTKQTGESIKGDSELVEEIDELLGKLKIKDNGCIFAVKTPQASFAIDDMVKNFSNEYFLLYHELKKMTVIYFLPKGYETDDRFKFETEPIKPAKDCAWVNIGNIKPDSGNELLPPKTKPEFGPLLDDNNKLKIYYREGFMQSEIRVQEFSANDYFYDEDSEFYYRAQANTQRNTLYKISAISNGLALALFQEQSQTQQYRDENGDASVDYLEEVWKWVDDNSLKQRHTRNNMTHIRTVGVNKMNENFNFLLQKIDGIFKDTQQPVQFKHMLWYFIEAILQTPSRDDQARRLETFAELFETKIKTLPIHSFDFRARKDKNLYLHYDSRKQIMYSSLYPIPEPTKKKHTINKIKEYDEQLDNCAKKLQKKLKDYFYVAPFIKERKINQHDGQCKLAHAHCEFLFDHVYADFFKDNQTLEEFHDAISHLKLIYVGAANTKNPTGEVWTQYKQQLSLRPELKIRDSEFLTMMAMNNFHDYGQPSSVVRLNFDASQYDTGRWVQAFKMMPHFYQFDKKKNVWRYVNAEQKQTLKLDDKILHDSAGTALLEAFLPFRPRVQIRQKIYCQYSMLRGKYKHIMENIQDGSWMTLFGRDYVASGTRSERYLADFLKLFPTGDILLIDPQAINEVELRDDLGMEPGDGRLEIQAKSFTTDMCIRLAQACRTRGTYWQPCNEGENLTGIAEENVKKLRARLRKSPRISIEEWTEMDCAVQEYNRVRVQASGSVWTLVEKGQQVDDERKEITVNDDYFLTIVKTVHMDVEAQTEYEDLWEQIEVDERIISIGLYVWTCALAEDGQILVWSLDTTASSSNQEQKQNILAHREDSMQNLRIKLQRLFIVPKEYVYLTETQVSDLKLENVKDETRVTTSTGSHVWEPKFKSHVLKPVLQTPVFISDARKDFVIRNKSMETAAVHALAETIKGDNIQPVDVVKTLDFNPANFPNNTHVGPVQNQFYKWNAAKRQWYGRPIWTSMLAKTRRYVVKIGMEFYKAGDYKIDLVDDDNLKQVANLGVNFGRRIQLPLENGIQQMYWFAKNGVWIPIFPGSDYYEGEYEIPSGVFGPLDSKDGNYYRAFQEWHAVKNYNPSKSNAKEPDSVFLIGPIGDQYYQKGQNGEWKPIQVTKKLLQTFTEHVKNMQPLKEFRPQAKDLTVGPFEGYFYDYKAADNAWVRTRKAEARDRRQNPQLLEEFALKVEAHRQKFQGNPVSLHEDQKMYCLRSIKTLVMTAAMNAEETCASYVNNAIWLLILAGFFDRDNNNEAHCYANIKTSLTTFAAMAPRMPLLFEQFRDGQNFVHDLLNNGIIAEFLPGVAEGFGCRPNAMESRHWVRVGQSLHRKKPWPKSQEQDEFQAIRHRIASILYCKTIFISSELQVVPSSQLVSFVLFSKGRVPISMFDATKFFDQPVMAADLKRMQAFRKKGQGIPRHVNPMGFPFFFVAVEDRYYVPVETYLSYEMIDQNVFQFKIGSQTRIKRSGYNVLMQRDFAQKMILDKARTPWTPVCEKSSPESKAKMAQQISDLLNKRLSMIAINSMNTTPKSQPTLPRFEQKLEATAMYDRILKMWYQSRKNSEDSQVSILTQCMQEYLASNITEEHKSFAESYVNLTWQDAFDNTISNFETQQKSMIQWRDRLVGPFWLTGYIFEQHMRKMFEMLYWSWISSNTEHVAKELDKYFETKKENWTAKLRAYVAILQTLSYGTYDMPYLETLKEKLQNHVAKHTSVMLEVNLIPENYRMFIQDYAYSEGSRNFLSEVERVLAIRFYNYITLQGSEKLQQKIPIASLIRYNAEQRRNKDLPLIPINMFRKFDENRSVLFTQHSVFEWPAGKIGHNKNTHEKKYGNGFKMIHRIIEMDLDEVLVGILKSTAFGYKIHGNASSHMDPELFETSKDAYKIDNRFFDLEKAKQYPHEYSTKEEREEAWKECIVISANYSVEKCSKTLLQNFIQQHIDDIADNSHTLLTRIREDIQLRETVLKEEMLVDSTGTHERESLLQKAIDRYGGRVKFDEWKTEHKKFPKHGEFFGQKFMSSLCWNHTVRPYEYDVQCGEDFMKSWVHLIYFCKTVHPLELMCLLYQFDDVMKQVEPFIFKIQNMPDLSKHGEIFRIDMKTFSDHKWIEIYQSNKYLRNPTSKANKMLASFIIQCIVVQDCLERFTTTVGFEKEKQLLGL